MTAECETHSLKNWKTRSPSIYPDPGTRVVRYNLSIAPDNTPPHCRSNCLTSTSLFLPGEMSNIIGNPPDSGEASWNTESANLLLFKTQLQLLFLLPSSWPWQRYTTCSGMLLGNMKQVREKKRQWPSQRLDEGMQKEFWDSSTGLCESIRIWEQARLWRTEKWLLVFGEQPEFHEC